MAAQTDGNNIYQTSSIHLHTPKIHPMRSPYCQGVCELHQLSEEQQKHPADSIASCVEKIFARVGETEFVPTDWRTALLLPRSLPNIDLPPLQLGPQTFYPSLSTNAKLQPQRRAQIILPDQKNFRGGINQSIRHLLFASPSTPRTPLTSLQPLPRRSGHKLPGTSPGADRANGDVV